MPATHAADPAVFCILVRLFFLPALAKGDYLYSRVTYLFRDNRSGSNQKIFPGLHGYMQKIDKPSVFLM